MIYFWRAWTLAGVAYAAHSAVTFRRQTTRAGRQAEAADAVFGLGTAAWGLAHVTGPNSVWDVPLGLLSLIGLIGGGVSRRARRRGQNA